MKTLHLTIIAALTVVILFHFNTISAQNETTSTIYFDHPNYFTENMSCYYYDTGKMLSLGQVPKKTTITVADPSANKSSTSIDHVTISVWSDSDKKGIEITAYETTVNSGIFKGTVTISEGQSTQDVIHVSYGDTLTARYAGTTSWPLNATNHGTTTTAFIGTSCPPFERVPASGINITDNEGKEPKTMLVNKQIRIGSKLDNVTIRNQTFAYIVQILDENKNVESLSSISGLLLPAQTFSPSVSWTPTKAGNYVVNVFVWQAINNPNALSPPLSTNLTVLHNFANYNESFTGNAKRLHCELGHELVIKSRNNSTACVTLQSSQKLVERGWAKKIIPSMPITEILHTKNQTSSDALKLLLSTNSTRIKPNQTLGIDITLNNTSPNVLVKDSSNNWSAKGLGPCELDPVSIDVYKGNYSLENVTKAKRLQMYENGTYNCPMLVKVTKYVFEPSSDKDISETPNGNFTGDARYHVSFDGFYTLGVFQMPPVGTYTIIASDEWGYVAIQHFTVVSKIQSVANSVIMRAQNTTSGFTIYSGGGGGSIYSSPTCLICTPEYFNETNTYTGNVGKIIPGYPIFVEISDPYSMSPRTDQISARDIMPNGTFHYTINVTGKFGENKYTLNFIYGKQKITETLPIVPP